MELRTYTNLWQVERRIYRIYDINLPYPVSVKQIGTFFVATVPWVMFLIMIRFPFSSPWHVVWILPPVMLTWAANKPLVEDKSLMQLATSQILYFWQSRTYTRLTRYQQPTHVTLTALVWNRDHTPHRRLPPQAVTGTVLPAHAGNTGSSRNSQ